MVFAILGNWGELSSEQISAYMMDHLVKFSTNSQALEKYLTQVRILANLRKLQPFLEKIMESITKYITPENDLLYQKGIEQGIEKGIE